MSIPPTMFSKAENVVISGGTFVVGSSVVNGGHSAKHSGFHILLKHVAVGAIHNAAQRFDPPRCHPGTRVAAQNRIKSWAEISFYEYPILWLNGLMGAGKSAIAQIIAEYFHEATRKYLLATFIFSRSAGNRNDARAFVSTIAYQIALSLPQTRSLIELAVEEDPLIFEKSLEIQLHALVILPLQSIAIDASPKEKNRWPRLIVIDGLDECQGYEAQQSVLQLLCALSREQPIPLAVFITSRPEPTIRNAFNTGILNQLSTRIALDSSYNPDKDIRKFLVEEFAHMREHHESVAKLEFPHVWPTVDTIKTLLAKSSGQFIYPSVVVKFVGSIHYNPIDRLDFICGISTGFENDNPYAELDALFVHIFSCVKPRHLPFALRILGFKLAATFVRPHRRMEIVESMEKLLSLKKGDSSYILADLSSVVQIDAEGVLSLPHASLPEFLLDKSRSGIYHIDMGLTHADFLVCYIQTSKFFEEMEYYEADFEGHMDRATPTAELREILLHCDAIDVSMSLYPIHPVGWERLIAFVEGIQHIGFPDTEDIQHHLIQSAKHTIIAELDSCRDSRRPWIHFVVVLLSSVSTYTVYSGDLHPINPLWEDIIYSINFLDEEIYPPNDAFTICQPITIVPLSALELFRSFIKDIYSLPSEYYPMTVLFILRCLFFPHHPLTSTTWNSTVGIQVTFKTTMQYLQGNERVDGDGSKAQTYIQEYVMTFTDVLIPLLRQSEPLSELEDYLVTPEAMIPIDLLSPFMPEGKTIKDEVNRYLTKCADARKAEWKRLLDSLTPEPPNVYAGILATSVLNFILPRHMRF